jgi:predicted dehydrogenase
MCGFTYRRVPAVVQMARFVAEGRIGQLRHVRAVYLQDWLVDPLAPMSWRLDASLAGSGAIGDIASHIVDMVQYVTGQRLTGVAALTETFVHERPVPTGSGSSGGLGGSGSADAEMGQVTVDDAAIFVSKLDGGALATFEATRFATGRKNALRVELNGSKGAVAFDLERLNELEFYDAGKPAVEQGFTRILVTEAVHPYIAAWWPPGHLIGYEHGFTHQARDLLDAIATGTDPRPSFADALGVQQVLDAVSRSAGNGSAWTPIPEGGETA